MPWSAGPQVYTDSIPVEGEETSQDGARQPPKPQAVLRQVNAISFYTGKAPDAFRSSFLPKFM